MSSRSGKRLPAPEHCQSTSHPYHNEFRISAAAHPDGRMAVLLSRYPELSGFELEELLAFMRKAGPLQLRRLRSTEAVRSKLDRFLAEHEDTLIRRSAHVSWTITLLAALLICWLLWDGHSRVCGPGSTRAELGALASGLAVGSHGEARRDP